VASRPPYVAALVQRVVFARYGLATRIGLGPHPHVARIAAANAHLGEVCAVSPEDAAGFISGWDVSQLPSVSKEQAREMRTVGLRSVGDVAAAVQTLRPYVGTVEAAEELRPAARGAPPDRWSPPPARKLAS